LRFAVGYVNYSLRSLFDWRGTMEKRDLAKSWLKDRVKVHKIQKRNRRAFLNGIIVGWNIRGRRKTQVRPSAASETKVW
jgi:hypothetical protein